MQEYKCYCYSFIMNKQCKHSERFHSGHKAEVVSISEGYKKKYGEKSLEYTLVLNFVKFGNGSNQKAS